MIQEFISKEILPHIFWVFAPRSWKWIFACQFTVKWS